MTLLRVEPRIAGVERAPLPIALERRASASDGAPGRAGGAWTGPPHPLPFSAPTRGPHAGDGGGSAHSDFDTPDPPIEAFSLGGEGAQPSLGDDRGSSLGLEVQLPPEAGQEGSARPPDEGSAMVILTPIFEAGATGGLRIMTSGEVEVTEPGRTGDEIRLRGIFSGRLE